MKKYLISIGFLIALFAVKSQSLRIGLKGGLNFPSAEAFGLDGTDVSGQSGYHAGLFASFKISKIAIQPELLYSFTKFEYENAVTSSILNSTTTAYLTVPIMVKIYLIQGINIQAGPQFGLLVGGETSVQNQVNKVKDNLKASDMAFGIGAGIDLPVGLDIHMRYNFGITDNSEITGEMKINTFQISLGYAIFKIK